MPNTGEKTWTTDQSEGKLHLAMKSTDNQMDNKLEIY